MMQTPLFFNLHSSLLKILLQTLVLLVYMVLATMMTSSTWVILSTLLFVLLIFAYRPKYQVKKMAHLEQQSWTLQMQDQTQLQAQLCSIQSFGYVVFCHFCLNSSQKKHVVCIVKDQIDLKEWRILQQFCRLH